MGVKADSVQADSSDSRNKTTADILKGIDSKLNVGLGNSDMTVDLIWSKEAHFPLPVIVYFHSETLISADNKRGLDLCRFLSKRGYMVVNTALRPVSDNIGIEDELCDILSVLKWISDNSEEYRLDCGSVYVTGSSYGGLVALWSTLLLRTSRIKEYFDVPDISIRIKGVGLFCGLSDPDSILNKLMKPLPKAFRNTAKRNPGLASCLRVWNYHDLRTLPPVFQVCSVISTYYTDSVRLDRLMETNAVPHELLLFPSGEESFSVFLEIHPESVYSTRAISKMLNLFQAYQ